MPSLVGRKPFRGQTDLRGHTELELIIRDFKERKELSSENSHVLFVNQGVGEFESSSTNGDVSVAKTVENRVSVPLDGVGVHSDNFIKGIESNISVVRQISTRAVFAHAILTHRILLSRLLRNLPRMLMAMTRRPLSASISNTVRTVSYRIEFPTFFVESVLVATCARISFMVSLAWTSPLPNNLRRRSILT